MADVSSVVVDVADGGTYRVDPEDLNAINGDKDSAGLAKFGGAAGLAKALCSNVSAGLDPNLTGSTSIEGHRERYGANKYKEVPPKSFFLLLFEAFKDPVIIILCIAALVSTIIGSAIKEEREENKWIEGVAIWIAVFLVTLVSSGNDYQKDLQFRKLNAQKDIIEVKVIRGGDQLLVKNQEVVVGDILLLDAGDKVIADGVVVEGFGLVLDEASLTGESDPIKKTAEGDPWVRSGTQVSEGSGKILVVAVGDNSEWGKTMALVNNASDDETPLQEKLGEVAATVGKIGAAVAVCTFVALLIKWCVVNRGFPLDKINDHGPVQFFLYAVTVVVVAIPEGLPLAVTIALAYSMKKMMRDNNFVRVLAACETMGGATAICSDKTGTLTENRMTVTEGWFAGEKLGDAPEAHQLHEEVREELARGIALNSKAFLIDKDNGVVDFVGNRTECALLMLARKWNLDYKNIRQQYEKDIVQIFGFSSAKKMASVLIRRDDGYRLYNKGAAEWVLKRCDRLYTPEGAIETMTEEKREELLHVVVGMASRGLRCICLTYTDFPLHDAKRPADFFENSENCDHNLVALAIVGIKDPVRKEVPDAVATCQKAGITVRMVTGDNIHTARHIARECGILDEKGIAMEGPVFRETPEAEMVALLPKLQVLARSSPEDKLKLVALIKKQKEVVAVTGDGTNDAPALKESDVGLAMGIAGTEVAKEAADIVILDDNFSSIVKSVLWGRSVYCSIQKFLMFQLTVNFVALVVSFVGSLTGRMPLNVLQLLWVNLIMDTMGALALATEDPRPELLDEKPHGREEPLITGIMFKHIIAQGFYQMFWMFLCLYGLPTLDYYKLTPKCDFYGSQGNALCESLAMSKLNWPSANATFHCGVINHCGFPCNRDSRETFKCPLAAEWKAQGFLNQTGVIPDKIRPALCGGKDTKCQRYKEHTKLKDLLEKEHRKKNDEEFMRSASVIFNIFIFAQVANEINARRIKDEYTIFQGLHKSPIFLGILGITVVLQVIIINFLGMFFKVETLNYKEWLITVTIGIGSIPYSLFVRFLSKVLPPINIRRRRRTRTSSRLSGKVADGGRTMSGKTMSGGRTVSGPSGPGEKMSKGNNVFIKDIEIVKS